MAEFKKELFISNIRTELEAEGLKVNLEERTVNKLNDSYESLSITPEGEKIGINIKLDNYEKIYNSGKSMDEVVDDAVNVIINALQNQPSFDVESFTDYSQMKNTLIMEVVSTETNKEMLETVPHDEIEDMSVVYRFLVNKDEKEGSATILITNEHLKALGVTPEQLHADALENAPLIKPAEIRGMTEVLLDMMGADSVSDLGLEELEEEKMYVAGVHDNIHGASVIAYQNFMDQASERIGGGDFFILPSSIHEVLIVPDNGEMDFEELENMVREVNATQVSPQDKLTDNVYHYDATRKVFELASKFVSR